MNAAELSSFPISLYSHDFSIGQDPHKNDPTRIKPGTNDPRKNDPTRINPETNDPGKIDPTRIDPETNDPGKVDPTHIPGPAPELPPAPTPGIP